MIKQFFLFKLTIISLILIIFPASVYAENRAGSGTLTLGAGYYSFNSKRHIENTEIPFIALGFNFTDQWGIEGLYGQFITRFDRNMPKGRRIKGNLFAVDGLYHFCPYRNIQPFVLAGVGILGMNPNGNDANNEGNINAGVGLQWFPDKIVAFRIEARDFYTMMGGKNDVYLDAGVTFFLDFC